MYEDSKIELTAFGLRRRVFCIASAGCTARTLSAAGHHVTAVDVNPEQIHYAQARLRGAPAQEGRIDRLLSRARTMFPLLGWTQPRLREFLSMQDPLRQLDFWRRKLDTYPWRISADVAFSSRVLALAYRPPFLACLPPGFGSVLRARLERTWKNHPNHSNPYAWRYFLGEAPPALDFAQPEPGAGTIRFACEDAAVYLESCKPASFDAFSLSNILDAAPSHYAQRLRSAIERSAAPGALILTRSFAEPCTSSIENFAPQDRSLLWGTVYVTELANLCSIF